MREGKEKKQRHKGHFNFAGPVHGNNFIVFIEGRDDIPLNVIRDLENKLGEEWVVVDRGTRLEVGRRDYDSRRENDQNFNTAVAEVFKKHNL